MHHLADDLILLEILALAVSLGFILEINNYVELKKEHKEHFSATVV